MKNKIGGLLLLTLLLFWTVGGASVLASAEDEPNLDLEPVIYEKLKFKKNTDYLHDSKKVEMKNTIPTKQFDIYFDGRKKLPKRSDGSSLFRTSERGEKSTVAVKSAELNLFTKTEVAKNERSPVNSIEEETAGNRTRTMILLAIIAAGLVVVFTIFLPKLVNAPDGSKPTG